MTGWSTGCAMAQAFANDASDILAAMACMSMYLLEEPSSGYNAIPIMEIHGLEDPIAPYGSLVTSSIRFFSNKYGLRVPSRTCLNGRK